MFGWLAAFLSVVVRVFMADATIHW